MITKTIGATLLVGAALITSWSTGTPESHAPGTQAPAIVAQEPLKSDAAVPSPGKARVIFYRPESGGGVDLGVHDGDRLVAKLFGHTYGAYECDPGPHVFSGSFGNMEILNATLLPDRIYYVKGRLVAQMWTSAFVELTPLHPGTPGKEWTALPRVLSRLKKSVVTPEQAERDKKGIGHYMERLKAYQDKPGAVPKSLLPEHGQSTSFYVQ